MTHLVSISRHLGNSTMTKNIINADWVTQRRSESTWKRHRLQNQKGMLLDIQSHNQSRLFSRPKRISDVETIGCNMKMELLLALGLPAILLIGATLLLSRGKIEMPNFLHKAGQNNAVFWNIMIATSIAAVLIKAAMGK